MKATIDKYVCARNSIDKVIDDLVKESLNDFDTYGDAINAIKKMQWDLAGSLGKLVIDIAVEKVHQIALKKATNK